MYINPIQMNRLLGILNYFNHSINTFHTIPDILLVTSDFADTLGSEYVSTLRKNDIPDDIASITLPPLTGSGNWCVFKDKLLLNLSMTKSTRGGISLEYIADVS